MKRYGVQGLGFTGLKLYPRHYPRGSIYTTIGELGPKIPHCRRNYGSQFPNGCICGPSGYCMIQNGGPCDPVTSPQEQREKHEAAIKA